jgi:hypothetical protein
MCVFAFAFRFTMVTADRERQRAQPDLRDVAATLSAAAVMASVQACEGLIDSSHRGGPHLEQGELQIILDVGVGAVERVTDVSGAGSPALADAEVHLVLPLAFVAE